MPTSCGSAPPGSTGPWSSTCSGRRGRKCRPAHFLSGAYKQSPRVRTNLQEAVTVDVHTVIHQACHAVNRAASFDERMLTEVTIRGDASAARMKE